MNALLTPEEVMEIKQCFLALTLTSMQRLIKKTSVVVVDFVLFLFHFCLLVLFGLNRT